MPKKKSLDTQVRRDLILDAARSLFSHHGYEETTIADIAREAKMAVGTIYLYYRNKHEIYTAVSLSFEEELAVILENPLYLDLPFRTAMQMILSASFESCRNYTRLLKLKQTDIQTQEESEQHAQSNERLTQAIEKILQHAIARGELAPFDSAMYAQLINLFGESVLHQCFAMEDGEREERYLKATIEFLDRLFFGPSLATSSP
jgi:AcrR family transcriptional regulator